MPRKQAVAPKAGDEAKPAQEGAAPAPAPVERKKRERTPDGRLAPFVPTQDQRQLVMLCVACGMTQEQIARQVNWPQGISLDTLLKYFREELDNGGDRIGAIVARNLLSIATDRNHKNSHIAAMFWLKSRRGWRDRDAFEAEAKVSGGSDSEKVTVTLRIGERESDV